MRFAHLGAQNKLPGMVNGLKVPSHVLRQHVDCPACVLGQQKKLPHPPSLSEKVDKRLALVHSDLMGPMRVQSERGHRYVLTFLDAYSGYAAAVPIRYKSEAGDVLRALIQAAETQTGERVKVLRSDNGGEYISGELQEYFANKGIEHQRSAPYTPEENGAAERLNGVLMGRVRSELIHAAIPHNQWDLVLDHVAYVRNRSPSVGKEATPYELFKGKRPDVSRMRVLGCQAFVHVPKALRSKLQPVAQEGIFMGYKFNSTAYKVRVNGKLVLASDVTFNERVFPYKRSGASLETLSEQAAPIEYVRWVPEASGPPGQEPREPEVEGAQVGALGGDPPDRAEEGELAMPSPAPSPARLPPGTPPDSPPGSPPAQVNRPDLQAPPAPARPIRAAALRQPLRVRPPAEPSDDEEGKQGDAGYDAQGNRVFNVEAIRQHYPRTATSHAETQFYNVKWENYAPHSSYREPADTLYEDVPHFVEAYWILSQLSLQWLLPQMISRHLPLRA
jgi:transposase InsO family protein